MTTTAVSDSYLDTIEEADALAATRPNSTSWAGSGKAAALQEATRRIDSLPLRGTRYQFDQDLEFPRIIDGVGVGDPGSYAAIPEIPTPVKWACLEEAIAILSAGSGGRQALQEQGVVSFSIGGQLSETFKPGMGSSGLQSSAARRYMRRYMGAMTR